MVGVFEVVEVVIVEIKVIELEVVEVTAVKVEIVEVEVVKIMVVDVEVVDERLLEGHLGRLDAGDFLDDLGDAGNELFLGGSHCVVPFRVRVN